MEQKMGKLQSPLAEALAALVSPCLGIHANHSHGKQFVTQCWQPGNQKLRQQQAKEEKNIAGSKRTSPGLQTMIPKTAGRCPKPVLDLFSSFCSLPPSAVLSNLTALF